MEIAFSKYQGTGNDFVMIDNRSGQYDHLSVDSIRQLCDRRFGIGADGLIKINAHPQLDFEVDYYNADGSKSFCGNGARCAVKFCHALGIDVSDIRFMAIDGEHKARLQGEVVLLEMADVSEIEQEDAVYILDTGSPHYVKFVANVRDSDVTGIGKSVRYSDRFKEQGINVNLLQVMGENHIRIRTYERGVEDETLSCGTGATACAMAYACMQGATGAQDIWVDVEGGTLTVSFMRTAQGTFENVWLIGPAEQVFEGGIHG